MFCPRCGKAEQAPGSYCRSCGEFLTDPSDAVSLLNKVLGVSGPEKQLTISLGINLVTAAVSSLLFIFLMGFFDGQHARTGASTPKIIYLVYVFLGLVAIWQLISFLMGAKLKSRLTAARRSITAPATADTRDLSETRELLPEADFDNVAPHSVTEEKTKVFEKRR